MAIRTNQKLKNAKVFVISSLDTGLPPRVRASTFCGCASFWMFSFRALNTTRIRTTFTLPPVLPAMASTTIRKNRIILENVSQRPKSAVAYPVVVMTETTWNDAWQ